MNTPWRAVRMVGQACRVTRRLDDRVRDASGGGIEPGVLQEQAAIDAELADRRATPWRRPCSALRVDVMSAVEARRNGRASRAPRGGGSRRIAWGLAALAAIVAGWAVTDGPRRAGPSTLLPQAADSTDALGDLAFDLRPAFAERMDEPLQREARALREDTSRAATVLMDGLTLEAQGDSLPR